MPAQASKQYQNITPQNWNKIKRAASAWGILIKEDKGETESMGVKLQWVMSLHVHVLSVAILDSGLLRPEDALDMVDGIIQRAIW